MGDSTDSTDKIDRLRRRCRFAEAEEAVATALEAEGERPDLLVLRGRIDLDRERPVDALRHFDRAAELAQEDDGPRAWRVAALSRAHRCDEACEVAEQDLLTFPESVVIRVALARVLIRMGRPDRALLHLDDALALDDGDANALDWRVVALYTQYRYDEAEAAAVAGLKRCPGDPDLRVSLAAVHAWRRRHRDAIAELDHVLRTDPEHVDSLEDRISCLRDLSEIEQAERAALDALELLPGSVDLRVEAAGLYAAQQRHDEALGLLDEGLATEPDQPFLLDWKAAVLRSSGRHQDAEQLLRAALTESPGAVSLHVQLARLLEERNRLDEALEAAETAVRLSPYLSSALGIRVRLLKALARPDEAERAAREATATRPYDTSLRRDLGGVLFARRRYSDALGEFREAVRLDPYDTVAWSRCIRVLWTLHRYDEAERCAGKALELVSDATDIIAQLGLMYQWQTRYEEAAEQFALAARVDPNDRRVREQLVTSQRMDRQFRTAETSCREALARFPGDADLYVELAKIYLEQNLEDKAFEILREGLSVCRPAVEIRMRMALAHHDLGRYEAALTELGKVLEENPRHGPGLFWRIATLEDMRNFSEAEKAARDAVRLLPENIGLRVSLAWMRVHQGDDEDGLRHVREARDIDQNHVGALRAEARILRRLRRHDDALVLLTNESSRFPDSVPLLVEQSLIHRCLGQYEEALEVCRRARTLDPWSIWATRREIDALRDLNRLDEAETRARDAVRRFPHDAGLLTGLGQVYDDKNRYEDALTWFDKALTLAPSRSGTVLAKSGTLRSLRRFGEAERLVRKGLKRDDSDRALRGELGWIHRDWHRLTEARAEFEGLAEDAVGRGERADALRGLGWVAFSQGDLPEAIRHFRAASLAEPGREDALVGLAWALLRTDAVANHDEVERLCLAVLETEPMNHTVHTCLGVLHARARDFALAEHHLKRSIEIDEHDGSYVDLGALYVQLGRFDEARALLEKALERDWYDVQAHIELGNLHLQRDLEGKESGDGAAAAVTHFRQCLLIDPANGAAAIGLSLALARAPGNLVGAERVLRAVLERPDCDRPRWQLLLALARLLIERGDSTQRDDLYVEALSVAQDAIELADAEPEPHFVAGVATFKIGESGAEVRARPFHRRRAVRYLRRCVRLDPGHAEARRVLLLVRQSLRMARGSVVGSSVLIVTAVVLLVALWVGFFLRYEVTAVMLTTLTPVLAGLVTLGFLLPFLVRLKLPGGIEADLSASLSQVSSGPTGEVSIGPGRFGRGSDPALPLSSLSAGPRGELPRLN